MAHLYFYSHTPNKYPTDNEDITRTKPWVYSNWWPATYKSNGITYCCVEQEMMHCKAMLFGDTATAAKILATNDPATIKALGRQAKGFNQHKWDQCKYNIVYDACLAKFGQNPDLKAALFATGDRLLVEASPYDRVWGIGYSANRAEQNYNNWGQNLLGEALTMVREDLRAE